MSEPLNDPLMLSVAAGCAAGILPALFALVWTARQRKASGREAEALRKSFEREQMVCLEMFTDVHRKISTFEEGLASLRQMPRAGGLNRSTRAQAMQLLRSGQTADAAASSLGIGRREMRLLERVSWTLCGRS
jgi:hypothetical protein